MNQASQDREGLEKAVLDLVRDFVARLSEALEKQGLSAGGELRVTVKAKPSVREMVLATIGEKDYLTSSLIADELEDRIVTRSTNPRQVILSTVSSLHQQGFIIRDSLGRLSLTDGQGGAHHSMTRGPATNRGAS